MKNLLPLTLQSNCYTLPAHAQPLCLRGEMAAAEEGDDTFPVTVTAAMDEEEACNFPEVLARDLDLSNMIFAARNMTAGAPARDLAYDDHDWHMPVIAPKRPTSSSYQPAVRFQPIRPIVEAHDTPHDCELSDAGSSSSGPSFSDPEPAPSVLRHSAVTASTSVTTADNSSSSDKRKHSIGHDTNASWIDFDPEDADDEAESSSIEQVSVPARPATHAGNCQFSRSTSQTPSRAVSANGAGRWPSNPFEGVATKPADGRTWSLQVPPRPATAMARNRSLDHVQIPIPQRRSSLKHQQLMPVELNRQLGHDVAPPTPAPEQSPVPELAPSILGANEVEEDPVAVDDDLKEDIEPWFRYVNEGEGEDARPVFNRKRKSQMGLPSPLDDVQHWLEASTEGNTEMDPGRRMRLPPETLETLRVSTTCFPETMLLCSSLSIETIRTYSKKVKHPAAMEPSRLATPPPSPKRWKWSSVLGQRRNVSGPNEPSPELNPPAEINPSPGQAQWSRLRNIFPTGSEHLLDALYAHLVAYSYVSSLCPRASNRATSSLDGTHYNQAPPTPERMSSDTFKSRDSNDIPKKAATLLGLQNAANAANAASASGGSSSSGGGQTQQPPSASTLDTLHPTRHRLLRKRSSFMDSLRSSRLPPPTQHAAASDNAPLRDLQLGLARCIARLVTTLRAAPSEEDEAEMLADEDNVNCGEVDPLLVRTLCEIVRCCEDSS